MPLHLHRVEVIEHVVHHHIRTVLGLSEYPFLKGEPGRRMDSATWEPQSLSLTSLILSVMPVLPLPLANPPPTSASHGRIHS